MVAVGVGVVVAVVAADDAVVAAVVAADGIVVAAAFAMVMVEVDLMDGVHDLFVFAG